MPSFNLSTRQIIVLFSSAAFLAIVVNSFILFGADAPRRVLHVVLPGQAKPEPELPRLKDWSNVNGDYDANLVDDQHPVHQRIVEKDALWDRYQERGKAISQNFSSIVLNYRERYGRNPPPHFDRWYKFARDRKVEIMGDFAMEVGSGIVGPFEQITDDLRPFWGVDPKVIRSLAGRMHSRIDDGIMGVHIRDGAVSSVNQGKEEWPKEWGFVEMIQSFVKDLPDMDIAVNLHSKPRVTVPWDELQKLLKTEEGSRVNTEHIKNEFSKHLPGLWEDAAPKETVVDPEWKDISGLPYMSTAKEACPPDSLVHDEELLADKALFRYKSFLKFSEQRRNNNTNTLIQNQNRSLDLCSMGPLISDLHTMLYLPMGVINTHRLVPIFSEGKTNVNNDILYPSAAYWTTSKDTNYAYDDKYDYAWEDKHDTLYWRGTVTSPPLGVDTETQNMQRDRLVRDLDAEFLGQHNVTIIGTDPLHPNIYGINPNNGLRNFQAAQYALDHSDAKFVSGGWCGENCDKSGGSSDFQNPTSLAEQFKNRFILDVDGDGISARFRALLQSRSLPVKSTLFKEWHSSRLFAWVHYVPLSIEYREIFSMLTYHVGYGNAEGNDRGEDWVNKDLYVQRHEFEGRLIAKRGSEWAAKVLRREDMEVYMYRLLLEYGRIIDDDRDNIGYPGDGSEVDESKWAKLIGLGN
ncbi:hypothetical protein VE01_03267 [Pseudogymnoascus verrucosus]|uniref:Glycosyl transferase CAP10 domain-containing protein n=1 Tax=Pseudogymnoascus verrucosus TaxID=342668 RepID=A0A1B8GSJ2_9PEZI|nr:uncharacterized protein VE01_03267 [Pseudogymnoascus verrucosus]OBT98799.1 hypothetical protein VE01_03267 [Pseudogymnoascus verrucosus]